MTDARDLAMLALQSVRAEPVTPEMSVSAIEAAVRRVIREMERFVAVTVQQDAETQR